MRTRCLYGFVGEMAQVLATNIFGIKRESRMQPWEFVVTEGRNSKVCKTLKVRLVAAFAPTAMPR